MSKSNRLERNSVKIVPTSKLANGTVYYSIRGENYIGDATPSGGDLVIDKWAMPNLGATTNLSEARAVAIDFATRHGLPFEEQSR
jgi:hypothetical protein